jgi:putative Mg2+ transporter-C (MgtC) family protein
MLDRVLNDPIVSSIGLMCVAVFLGGLLGAERESVGKPAGLRTHMLTSLGSALLVIACRAFGMTADEIGRVIQGIAAGIGFIGGGAILKMSEYKEVKGLTSAATIWLTAAVGVTVGLGRVWLAAAATVIALIVLAVLVKLETWLEPEKKVNPDKDRS